MTRALLGLVALVACACATVTPTLILNARLYDGTGAPGRRADVRIAQDRVAEIGTLRRRPGEAAIDASGLALAPGFIDSHSHHDEGLFDQPDAPAAVSQGITTIVVGQDGESSFPLGAFFTRLERSPPAINVASFVGHNTLRARVLGRDFRRAATPAEIERMAALLRDEMRAGALGLSTGLEYDPGSYSTTAEVLALARAAAALGGRYASHLRSEDRALWQAVDEALSIGRATGMPVHISHLKLAMRSLWGKAGELLARLDAARAQGIRASADVYPYPYWQSTLTVLFPARDYTSRAAAELALREIVAPEGLVFSRFDPDPSWVGRTLADVAARRKTDPASALLWAVQASERLAGGTDRQTELVIGTSMDERDVERLLLWPQASFCTDGALVDRHPRGAGAFPRILGRYVRERGVLSWEEAIRKATSLAAEHAGIRDRGRIVPGAFADLVLFDPATVLDTATPERPGERARGIHAVWVNGRLVYRAGGTTGERPGRVLRRGAP